MLRNLSNFIILFFLILISQNSVTAQSMNDSNNVLVFIHGIKGSILVDENNDKVWMNAGQALGFSTPNLALPKFWEEETQTKDKIKQREVFDKVTVIPYILEEKIYSPWLEAGEKLTPGKFYPFAYDWRRDNNESVLLFEKFLEDVKSKNPGKNITVVAHSMGGLISIVLLNKRPDLFQKVVFVGVPFYGGVGFLEDMHLGKPDGFNKKILAKEVLFTMPSVYTLFPAESLNHIIAEDKNGKPIEINFYSANDWKNFGLGIFGDPEFAKEKENNYNFLIKALSQAKKFKDQIKKADMTYPPILVISGKNFPTFSKILKEGKDSVNGWDFTSLPKEPGDDRVLEKNSFPPEGISYEIFYSDFKHSQILNDPKVVNRIKEFMEK